MVSCPIAPYVGTSEGALRGWEHNVTLHELGNQETQQPPHRSNGKH